MFLSCATVVYRGRMGGKQSGRAPPIAMKAPARMFQLSDWYGEDWDHKKPADDLWVSPWAKAHYKIRQQEIEIEQCEFMLKQAIEVEDYAEADGLKTRVERLKAQHPIVPREERLMEAIEDGNFALAEIFQEDLDSVMKNLGLPKYKVGQAVEHQYRDNPPLRGVIMDVDLQCAQGREWIEGAGCLERGCALDYEREGDLDIGRETSFDELRGWANQPFYVVMLDLEDLQNEDKAEGLWRWRYPAELAAWEVNVRSKEPAPLYLPEDAIKPWTTDTKDPVHPEMERLWEGHDEWQHRGRLYRPSGRLRLWQQKRQKDQQEGIRRSRAASLNSKNANPYDRMK